MGNEEGEQMSERKIPSKEKASNRINVRFTDQEFDCIIKFRDRYFPSDAIATVLRHITVRASQESLKRASGGALTAYAYPYAQGVRHTKLNDQDELKKIDLLQTDLKKSDLLQTDLKNSDQLNLGELTILNNTDLKKEIITEPHPIRPLFLSTNRSENQEKRFPEERKARLEAKRAAKAKSVSEAETARAVLFLNFLNSFLGTRYRPSLVTISMVNAVIVCGYTIDDIMDVTKAKCNEWANDERMRKFLRPKTLLKISNFENYYGALTMTAKKIDIRKEIKYTRAQVEQMKKDGVIFLGEISDE